MTTIKAGSSTLIKKKKKNLPLSKYPADHEATGLLGDLMFYGTSIQSSNITMLFTAVYAQTINTGLHAGVIHTGIIPE